MQQWLRSTIAAVQYPVHIMTTRAPRSILLAAAVLLCSGLLTSLTHAVLRTESLGYAWWMQSQYVAGPALVVTTVLGFLALHVWLLFDRWLGEHGLLFDRLPLDYDGTAADTFIVFAYTAVIPALLLWLPLLLDPSIPALAATGIIGIYTGYVAGHGFAAYHSIDDMLEQKNYFLILDVLGGAAILFTLELFIISRPSLVLHLLQSIL